MHFEPLAAWRLLHSGAVGTMTRSGNPNFNDLCRSIQQLHQESTMASAGGGSGVSGGGVPTFQPIEGASVQLPSGVRVDLSTAEGVAAAEANLTAEQLSELERLMNSIGFRRAGSTFVPRDDYQLRRELGVVGPSSTNSGMTDLDAEIGEKVFVAHGYPNPYNANTTEALHEQIRGSASFKAAVSALSEQVANPTHANGAEFLSRMTALAAEFSHGNIMELLFTVFRESIQATNEDKKYFLMKLQEFNTMAEKISEYLSQLVEYSEDLSVKSEGQKYPEKVHIHVECKTFDLSTLDRNGNLVATQVETKSLDRQGLNDRIKDVESMQETVRNKRQMASTAFQNFDQKSNQLYNLMASVMKALNEMRGGTVRNML
jgi:hypothetical protein